MSAFGGKAGAYAAAHLSKAAATLDTRVVLKVIARYGGQVQCRSASSPAAVPTPLAARQQCRERSANIGACQHRRSQKRMATRSAKTRTRLPGLPATQIQKLGRAEGRYVCAAHVRFRGYSGHAVLHCKCLLLTQSGHGPTAGQCLAALSQSAARSPSIITVRLGTALGISGKTEASTT